MEPEKKGANFQRKKADFSIKKRQEMRRLIFEKNRDRKIESEQIQEEQIQPMNSQAISNHEMDPIPELSHFNHDEIVQVLLEQMRKYSSLNIDLTEMNLPQLLSDLLGTHGSVILRQFLIELIQNQEDPSLKLDISKLLGEILLEFLNSKSRYTIKRGFQILEELADNLEILAQCTENSDIMIALENALGEESSSIKEIALNIGRKMTLHRQTFQQFAKRQFLKHYYFLLGESVALHSLKLNNVNGLNKILEQAEKMDHQIYATVCQQLSNLEDTHDFLADIQENDQDLLIESIFQRLDCLRSEDEEMMEQERNDCSK